MRFLKYFLMLHLKQEFGEGSYCLLLSVEKQLEQAHIYRTTTPSIRSYNSRH